MTFDKDLAVYTTGGPTPDLGHLRTLYLKFQRSILIFTMFCLSLKNTILTRTYTSPLRLTLFRTGRAVFALADLEGNLRTDALSKIFFKPTCIPWKFP